MKMEIFSKETIKKILKNKKKLESKLKVKIEVKGSEILLSGKELDIYIGEKVLEAIDKDFAINTALLLIDGDYILEEINIKDVTKKRNLSPIKARIIGTKGKTLKIISEISGCHLCLHNNTISILGPAEKIKEAETAIKSLIRGSKQSNIYSYLERQRKKPSEEDLGLKE